MDEIEVCMRIGLVDIDSHNFPNLVLMKLSTWYKAKGWEVELLRPADVLNGSNLFYGYDKLIGACVFDWNKSIAERLSSVGVYVGGTGTGDYTRVLPPEIEHCYPDYSLYGIENCAYGYLTRGCPRHCQFCVVAEKEGTVSYKVANLSEFWRGQKEIVFCDPNILACKDYKDLLQQVIDSKAKVEFNQGLDVRFINEESMEMLKKIKLTNIHLAWDNPRDEITPKKLEFFAERYEKRLKDVFVYVLVNYWSNLESDLKRIYWLRDLGFSPFVMVFDKPNAPEEILHLQRWCNNKWVFYSTESFEDYKKSGGGQNGRKEETIYFES